jgi:regulator of sigma E protease
MFNYLFAAICLGFVILFHEFGHFIAAWMVGIPIRIFSIGMGPKIWSFTKNGTEYRLSWIPFGGYVMPDVEDGPEFFQISPLRRIVMSAGGPLASIMLTIIGLALTNLLATGFSWYGTMVKPVVLAATLLGKMFASLAACFSKPGQLSSVVGIISEGGRFIGANWLHGLTFTALISLNLAMLNLLPFMPWKNCIRRYYACTCRWQLPVGS